MNHKLSLKCAYFILKIYVTSRKIMQPNQFKFKIHAIAADLMHICVFSMLPLHCAFHVLQNCKLVSCIQN